MRTKRRRLQRWQDSESDSSVEPPPPKTRASQQLVCGLASQSHIRRPPSPSGSTARDSLDSRVLLARLVIEPENARRPQGGLAAEEAAMNLIATATKGLDSRRLACAGLNSAKKSSALICGRADRRRNTAHVTQAHTDRLHAAAAFDERCVVSPPSLTDQTNGECDRGELLSCLCECTFHWQCGRRA